LSADNIKLVAGGGIAPPTPGKDPGKLLLAISCYIWIKEKPQLVWFI